MKFISDLDLEAIEAAVGMGHAAWDTVDPKAIVKAVLEHYAARPEERTQDDLNDEQLWRLVRAYHGWESDAEMIEKVGYSAELYIERMRRAWRESRQVMNSGRT